MIRETRAGFKVVYDEDRKMIFAIGGHNLTSNRILFPYVHQYDIIKDEWTELQDCSFANMSKACFFIKNKVLYIVSMPQYGKYF